MTDRATLAKARKELEDMYLGIPDDFVNLTFGDIVEVKPGALANKISGTLEPTNKVKKAVPVLSTVPSLDFSRALEATAKVDQYRYNNPVVGQPFVEMHHASRLTPQPRHQLPNHQLPSHQPIPYRESAYNGMSTMSMASSVEMSGYQDGRKRRRPGIPHSNICTICSNSIYMCRHRCLVCGRAYCKQCVGIGMGDMTEGRKCLECLGKKFSQRYIHKAGQVSCCLRFKYSSEVIQQELKWAEKGPKKTGQQQYRQNGLVSAHISPLSPKTTTQTHKIQEPNSFVMSSTYSSTTHHPLPF